MINVYRNNIGNADSRTHDYGNSARKIVENARTQVASILNITKDDLACMKNNTRNLFEQKFAE